jgi:ankyrin repeat protein
VDQNFKKVHEIHDALLKNFILDVKLSDPYFTYYASTTRDSSIDILKSALSDEIVNVEVYTCPMKGYPKWILHAYAVFQTKNKENEVMWWSFDKNGHHIVLQQSRKEEDVIKKMYDEKEKTIERPKPFNKEKTAEANRSLESLLRIIYDTYQLGEFYHLFLSNCWNFASFVFKHTNNQRKKWKPPISPKLLKCLNITLAPVIEQHGHNETSIQKSRNQQGFLRLALLEKMELEEFQRLTRTIQSINEMDDQGYTLLEWAEAFSRDDIKNYLVREKGVQSTSAKPNNVFFIALEYVQSNDFSVKPSDKIHFNGVNNITNDTALHLAMRGGKWEIVKEIFDKQKSNINSINSSKETPLHLAAQLQKCNIDLFQKILKEANTDIINKVDAKGYEPLHWAIHARSLDKTKELLKKGAKVYWPINCNGLLPLHLAVQRWSNSPDDRINEIFKLLVVKHKADIQAGDGIGNSVLNTAIQLKSVRFAELLLEKGANTTAKNGTMSLHLAVQWPECPEQLLKKILVRIKHDALHCALKSQSPNACKILLEEKEIDVNTATNDGEIALHLAAKWPNIEDELFEKILKNTSDINKTDNKGRTPLHNALMFKSVTATEQLLKQGATVNADAQTHDKYTALHLAAFWSDIPLETVENILEKEKDKINVKDNYDTTALHRAIESQSVFFIEKLLDSNADASIASVADLTPLHLAAQWKLKCSLLPDSQKNIFQLYVKRSGYKLDESSLTSDITPSLFNKILDKSSGTINSKTKCGETALHLALYSHSKTATDALLKHPELDVNIKDIGGPMAIHLAARWKDIDVEAFELILKNTHKDNLNQRHYWKTALDYAQESGSPPEIINLLQKAMDQQHVVADSCRVD